MKKLILILFLFVKTFFVYSQIPQSISYQGVANNANGTPITTPISLRISILDNSATGSEIYKETFTAVETTSQGVYSINIGLGTPVTGTFSNINWGINLKFIKVEMDATPTGTNYALVGTSQLMSVPYALYSANVDPNSKEPNAAIPTLINFLYLRTSNIHQKVKVVYVKCHTSYNDGGGGFFYWVDNVPDVDVYSDNDGTIIKPVNHTGAGRWIRKFEGYIDVRYFGCMGHSQPTDEQKIQRAIDFAASNYGDNFFGKGNTVFLRNGSYLCSKLILKSGVNLKGESKKHTSIGCKVADTNPYLIEIDEGVVENISVENINFIFDNQNPNPSVIKGCFNFKSKPRPNLIGAGLWNSTFKNILITKFTGNSINFEGGGGSSAFNSVNQFITLENVEAEGVGNLRQTQSNTFYPPVLRISGLNGQFVFTNCRFDGGPFLYNGANTNYVINGTNVYIGSNSADYNNVQDRIFYPQKITFNTCTFQSGEIGFYIQSGQSINISNSWFENFERAIMVRGNSCEGDLAVNGCVRSKQIDIIGNTFLRSAGRFGFLPANTGRVIVVENALVNIEKNYVVDSDQIEQTLFVSAEGTKLIGVNLSNNYFDPPSLGRTFGIIQNKNTGLINGDGFSVNGIKTESNKLIFVDSTVASTTGNIYRIDSKINTGESIYVKANKGNLTFYSYDVTNVTLGRNIYLNGRANLILTQGQSATFIKLDNPVGNESSTFQLVSISN